VNVRVPGESPGERMILLPTVMGEPKLPFPESVAPLLPKVDGVGKRDAALDAKLTTTEREQRPSQARNCCPTASVPWLNRRAAGIGIGARKCQRAIAQLVERTGAGDNATVIGGRSRIGAETSHPPEPRLIPRLEASVNVDRVRRMPPSNDNCPGEAEPGTRAKVTIGFDSPGCHRRSSCRRCRCCAR